MDSKNHTCCSGKGHSMERFMEVCLLLSLREGPLHGYGLAEHLVQYGFSQEDLNISTLYRTLRKMESEGFVVSDWELGGQGPKKRVYRITSEGEADLDDWINILRHRKSRIEKVLDVYGQALVSSKKDEGARKNENH